MNIQENLSTSPVFDLHCDAILKAVHKKIHLANDNPVSQVDVPKMRRGRVDGVTLSLWSDPVFVGEAAVARTQFMLDRALKEISLTKKDLHLVQSVTDLDEATRLEKIATILGVEGGPSINNSIEHLKTFHNQGVRRMTLVCTQSTSWACSTSDCDSDRGLSSFGRDVVHAMNDLGMIVDVAHATEKTVLDVAKITRKPIFCSHSLARAVFPIQRLASDEMIRAVVATGGIFGITFLASLFPGSDTAQMKRWFEDLQKNMNEGGKGSTLEERAESTARLLMDSPPPAKVPPIAAVLPHIDHVMKLVGDDHIGIGTDFDAFPFAPEGLEDVSKFDNLRKVMGCHGYRTSTIEKILGGNVRRVLREVLPS